MQEYLRPDHVADDNDFEETLRPSRLTEFVGQEAIKRKLAIYIKAAKQRSEALDHTLLYGPPGLGKTTLAHIIANEMEAEIRVSAGPVLERPGDLVGLLTGLNAGDVLFIDEIHRLPRAVEEYLYSAMEDYSLDIIIDKGPAARTISLALPKFTLVGATTRAGLITAPLRSRFGVVERMDYYPPEELFRIVQRSARILAIETDSHGAQEIARRSRGTPRIANRLLRRVRDYAQVEGSGIITEDIANAFLDLLLIDELGLDEMDRRILSTIIEKYDGGPVGIGTIAAVLGEDEGTIESIYEPFLMQLGFIDRTPRGRRATRGAYKHMKCNFSPESGGLFDG
ncbi:MAG TPA: Holliday junction branch migration DNA helicase RuvB [candidate division Zixibacteria bacterium]|nr:Holliday junction branch migration DNA helicase RuvB [candidate division Zixibacteria bacterium]